MRDRRKQQAYGRYDHGLIDVQPVRDHIVWLRTQGMGCRFIAAAAGIEPTVVSTIMWGRHTGSLPARVHRDTAAKILAVRPELDLLARGAMVDPTPYRRRLQALSYMGWTWRAVAERMGIDERRIYWFLNGQKITVGNARLIRDVYDELWNVTPTSTNPHVAAKIRLAMRRARDYGWLPPLAWDDIDNDPEPATPDSEDDYVDEIAVDEAVRGMKPTLTPRERERVVTILNERQLSSVTIADHIGCSPKTVERIRKRLNLPIYLQNHTHLRDGSLAA